MASRERLQVSARFEDRISQLPDCLIHHIFSFMPLPDVVQTCILAKRWKHLWASVQSLEFKNILRITNFENFVNSLLMLRELLDVSTFRLKLPERCDESINVWIVYAINHGAKVLDLDFDCYAEEGYELPDRLFTSQTLEELCVRHVEGIIGFPRSTSLKSLKKLHISFLELCSGDMQNMISGCPTIESLHIELCEISCVSGRCLDICSPTLKHLKIENGRVSGVRFHTPNLLRLHYEWHFVDVAWFDDDMPYLDYALLVCGEEDGLDVDFDVIVAGFVRIIMPVASTKALTLSGSWVDCIPMELSFPTFKNLKNLTVEKSCMRNLLAVAVIMQYTPNLEELTVKQIMEHDYYCLCDTCYSDEISEESPPSLPKVPLTCPKLTTVDFQYGEHGLSSSDMIKAFAECFLISPELKEQVIKRFTLQNKQCIPTTSSDNEVIAQLQAQIALLEERNRCQESKIEELNQRLTEFVEQYGQFPSSGGFGGE